MNSQRRRCRQISFLFKSPQQFQMKPNVSCWRTEAQKFNFGNTAKIKNKGEQNTPLLQFVYYAHWTEPVIQRCVRREGRRDPIMPPLHTSSRRPRLPLCISVGGERDGDQVKIKRGAAVKTVVMNSCMCFESGEEFIMQRLLLQNSL